MVEMSDDEIERRCSHRRSISIHLPNIDELEMATRVDIAKMRDRASVGMGRASEASAGLLSEAVRLATGSVFAQLPTSRLLRIRAAIELTLMAATAVERAQRDG